jgi:hypothetical protein
MVILRLDPAQAILLDALRKNKDPAASGVPVGLFGGNISLPFPAT